MRWLTFAILTVLVLTLQATVASRLELFSARPDFLLVVVVFLGLYVPSRDAMASGWILGACADLMTIERFGVIAVSYGLTAMLVSSLREYLFRYRVVTQAAVTLAACLLVRTAWTMYYHLLYNVSGPLLRDWLIGGLVASAYTAALAPFAFRVLLRMSRPLGIARPRYGYAGLTMRGRADV